MNNIKEVKPRRSLLFIPANRPDRFDKALASGADMVCLELEDGVAYAQKQMARDNMVDFFTTRTDLPAYPEILVRINALNAPEGDNSEGDNSEGEADLNAILALRHPPSSVMVPKVRTAKDVIKLEKILSRHAPKIALHLLIETAEALEHAAAIACSSPRIEMLLFGGVDLAAELRATTGWEPLLYARARVVNAAALAGVDVMDMPYLSVADESGLAAEAIRARDMGYGGKAAIHPNQVQVINDAFTPTHEDIAQARRVLAAYAEAPTGVVVMDGRLIEKPVILKMQHTLAIAEALQG